MSLEHLQDFIREGNDKAIQVHHIEDKKQTRAILTSSMIRERKSIERYNQIGENIVKSERLRAKITHSMANNDPVEDILLMALDCIGYMTGDFIFSNQNKKKLEGRA